MFRQMFRQPHKHKVPIATRVQVGSPELNTHKTFDSAVSNAAGTTTMDVSQRLSPQISLLLVVCEVSRSPVVILVASQVPCDGHRVQQVRHRSPVTGHRYPVTDM